MAEPELVAEVVQEGRGVLRAVPRPWAHHARAGKGLGQPPRGSDGLHVARPVRVPRTGCPMTAEATEAQVAAAMEALGCGPEQCSNTNCTCRDEPERCIEHEEMWTDRGCPVAVSVADAVVAAGPDPAKVAADAEVKVLREFAAHDMHGLQPFSEVANQWLHTGVDWVQREAAEWADRREATP